MSERDRGALHQPKEETLWYYRSLADGFCERLPGQLSKELREIVQVLNESQLQLGHK